MGYRKRISIQDKVAVQKRHWIRLTKACNNRCVFCLDSDSQNGSFVPLDDIKNDLKRARKNGIRRVVLSGGEPTLHPKFLEIIKFSKDIGFIHIQVITNGRMFAYRNFLYSVLKNGVTEITFSMHGHNKKLHETQTQIKGSFEQSLKGLKNALGIKDLIVSVDIVINKCNYKYLSSIIKYYINMGVSEFDLLQVVPFGRSWENRSKVFYNVDKAMPYLKRAFDISKKPNVFIWTNRFPARYLEGHENLIQHPIKLFDEIKGRKALFDKFIKHSKYMFCFGRRCKYCFLREFCLDLIELKNKGVLKSKKMPYCLNKRDNLNARGRDAILTISDNGFDIYRFCDFYIKNRYFVKGYSCKMCKYNSKCDGVPIDKIRRSGFNDCKLFINKQVK